MSAIEDLERHGSNKFNEAAFVEFIESIGGVSSWEPDGRWELIDGIPVDMPPATLKHGTIAQNFERLLMRSSGLRDRGLDVTSEAGIRHTSDGNFRPIADVLVYREIELKRGKDLFFETAQLVAEVLPPSTRHHDLLDKRLRYTELPECHHVLIIEQDRMEIRHWARSRGWAETVYTSPDDLIGLPEFGFSCRLRDLYARTDLA